jgi:hypothetical protein
LDTFEIGIIGVGIIGVGIIGDSGEEFLNPANQL